METNQLEPIRKKAQDAVDCGEIQNLFGRYQYLHAIVQDQRIPSLFSDSEPDIRVDLGDGVIEGQEPVKAYYACQTPYKGQLNARALLNPMIEIAGDGNTAKGLWVTAGTETFVTWNENPTAENFPSHTACNTMKPIKSTKWRIGSGIVLA